MYTLLYVAGTTLSRLVLIPSRGVVAWARQSRAAASTSLDEESDVPIEGASQKTPLNRHDESPSVRPYLTNKQINKTNN